MVALYQPQNPAFFIQRSRCVTTGSIKQGGRATCFSLSVSPSFILFLSLSLFLCLPLFSCLIGVPSVTNIQETLSCLGLEAVCWMFSDALHGLSSKKDVQRLSNGSLARSLGVNNACCRLLVDQPGRGSVVFLSLSFSLSLHGFPWTMARRKPYIHSECQRHAQRTHPLFIVA